MKRSFLRLALVIGLVVASSSAARAQDEDVFSKIGCFLFWIPACGPQNPPQVQPSESASPAPTPEPTVGPTVEDFPPLIPSPTPEPTVQPNDGRLDTGPGNPALKIIATAPPLQASRESVLSKFLDLHSRIRMSADVRKWVEPSYGGMGLEALLSSFANGNLTHKQLQAQIGTFVMSYAPASGDTGVVCTAKLDPQGNLTPMENATMNREYLRFVSPGCLRTFINRGELIGIRMIADGGLLRLTRVYWPGTVEYSLLWFDPNSEPEADQVQMFKELIKTHIYVGNEFSRAEYNALNNLVSMDGNRLRDTLSSLTGGRYQVEITSSIGGTGKATYYLTKVVMRPH